jgi:hypothetical protein
MSVLYTVLSTATTPLLSFPFSHPSRSACCCCILVGMALRSIGRRPVQTVYEPALCQYEGLIKSALSKATVSINNDVDADRLQRLFSSTALTAQDKTHIATSPQASSLVRAVYTYAVGWAQVIRLACMHLELAAQLFADIKASGRPSQDMITELQNQLHIGNYAYADIPAEYVNGENLLRAVIISRIAGTPTTYLCLAATQGLALQSTGDDHASPVYSFEITSRPNTETVTGGFAADGVTALAGDFAHNGHMGLAASRPNAAFAPSGVGANPVETATGVFRNRLVAQMRGGFTPVKELMRKYVQLCQAFYVAVKNGEIDMGNSARGLAMFTDSHAGGYLSRSCGNGQIRVYRKKHSERNEPGDYLRVHELYRNVNGVMMLDNSAIYTGPAGETYSKCIPAPSIQMGSGSVGSIMRGNARRTRRPKQQLPRQAQSDRLQDLADDLATIADAPEVVGPRNTRRARPTAKRLARLVNAEEKRPHAPTIVEFYQAFNASIPSEIRTLAERSFLHDATVRRKRKTTKGPRKPLSAAAIDKQSRDIAEAASKSDAFSQWHTANNGKFAISTIVAKARAVLKGKTVSLKPRRVDTHGRNIAWLRKNDAGFSEFVAQQTGSTQDEFERTMAKRADRLRYQPAYSKHVSWSQKNSDDHYDFLDGLKNKSMREAVKELTGRKKYVGARKRINRYQEAERYLMQHDQRYERGSGLKRADVVKRTALMKRIARTKDAAAVLDAKLAK